MTTEIKVPGLPESVADATVAKWYKKEGDTVSRDENLVDLETDKVMLEVPCPVDGVIESIAKLEGEIVKSDQVLCVIKDGAAGDSEAEATSPENEKETKETKETKEKQETKEGKEEKEAEEKPAETESEDKDESQKASSESDMPLSPTVRRLVSEHGLDVSQIKGTGKDGRIVKEDVEAFLEESKADKKSSDPESKGSKKSGDDETETKTDKGASNQTTPGREERVPMSRLRARVAERLMEAKQNTAMLTTFNEIDMHQVMELRSKYKEQFSKTYDIKLGFMSFFVKAAVEALKRYPTINASIDGKEIVYHQYFDIGVAVSAPRGLVVPVIRNADQLSMADIEKTIINLAEKAKNNELTIDEMTGGTFTITNGGVFGSMLSTPILNPPQCGILGMHNIVKRPVVVGNEILIRPVMYVALSYDHQLVDGRESVGFLLTIKQLLEDPARILLAL